MPSAMIHLLAARKYNENGSTAFFIGNLAPDSVEERVLKDKIHFRDQADRMQALEDFAKTLDLRDEFCIGYVLHLFLDLLWDQGPQAEHRRTFQDPRESWFLTYREEIARATRSLYQILEWGAPLFDAMLRCPPESYSGVPSMPPELITQEIALKVYHHQNAGETPPSFFSNEMIESFTTSAAKLFRKWLVVLLTK